MVELQTLPQPPGLDILAAEGPLALFLDFDGTLVDIALTPDSIDVPDRLNAALLALAERLDGRLALISGRGLDDIESHLGTLALPRAGSHGIDRRLADGTSLDGAPPGLPAAALNDLRAFAGEHGFALEEKPHGAALHYRSDPSLEEGGLAFATALAGSHGLVLKRGKCVIELVRPGADKGGAVRAFMAAPPFAGSRPLFVGDDVTDEDGFAAVEQFGGAGILVGDRSPTRAHYALAGTAQVYEWLGL